MKKSYDLDFKIINNIKALSVDMIAEAGSGHPGIALSAAPIVTTLFQNHLVFNASDPSWLNRDRFVISAGHGSALLYSTLFMSGYDLKLDDLKQFRKLNSITPGHPEYGLTPGVEVSTGPLGQGVANAVGMAIARKYLNSLFTIKKESLLDYHVYCLCSDGDLMEGVALEAVSLAGTLNLNDLILLYDANKNTLDNNLKMTNNEDIKTKFLSMNWQVFEVNSLDLKKLDATINKAKSALKPSIIIATSVVGQDSVFEASHKAHGSVLTKEQITELKLKLNVRDVPFNVSKEAHETMLDAINKRNQPLYDAYQVKYQKFINDEKINNLFNIMNNPSAHDVKMINKKMEMRDINQDIINQMFIDNPFVMSLSADLFSSTKTYLNDQGDFTGKTYNGRNIWCGVREHAMAAIANGLAVSGIIPIVSTFLIFSDYLKPSIRLSALMNLPVIYIFTHDAYNIGEDGPTHQPIEQLVALRTIPNLTVYRPADGNEIIGMYQTIINQKKPSVAVISKQVVSNLKTSDQSKVINGGYVIKQEENPLLGIIIATGTEVTQAVKIAKLLEQKQIGIRVISMPSLELYNKQTEDYKQSLLPLGVKTFVIEAGSKISWCQFVYNEKYIFGIDHFGLSASYKHLQKEFNLDEQNILNTIEGLLK